VNIRPAIPADAPAIAAIQVAAWRAAYRGHMPDAALDELDVSAGSLMWGKLLQSDHAITVAEVDGQTVAFCCVVPSRDPDHNPDSDAEISAIYVYPNHWRRGAGRALCTAAFAAAADSAFGAIALWVLATNAPAIRFYETMGFRRDSATKSETVAEGVLVQLVRLRRKLP
jgi:ribosomal protein S18 acetylase RimI-like enzyme